MSAFALQRLSQQTSHVKRVPVPYPFCPLVQLFWRTWSDNSDAMLAALFQIISP
jgi:hypothetical protein